MPRIAWQSIEASPMEELNTNFTPSGNAALPLCRLVFRTFGFHFDECLAAATRSTF
jgi:hypothetical protein